MERVEQLPAVTDEIREVQAVIIEAMPEVMREMGSLLGFDPRRISKADYRKLTRRMNSYFDALGPMIAAENAHKAAGMTYTPTYEDFERLFAACFRVVGKRLPRGVGAIEWLVTDMEKQISPRPASLRRNEDYMRAHNAVSAFADTILGSLGPDFEELMQAWNRTPELRKQMAMLRGWNGNSLDFPDPKPRRFTEGLLERTANTYRSAGAFWEMRLRYFAWLYRATSGNHTPPDKMARVPLAHVMKEIEACPSLTPLVNFFDRRVRNALAHGRPDWDRARGVCTFHDNSSAVEWTCGEFWDNTANLLLTAPALALLEPTIQTRLLRAIMGFLREATDSSRAVTPSLAR